MTPPVQNVLNRMPGGSDAAPGHYRWQSPAGDVSIAFDGEVVERLRQDVLSGFHALRKRGLEVGGILLGRVSRRLPLSIRVEKIEAIHCEHRFGPAFVLSDSDRAQLESLLERLRQQDLSVVGYYRSCTGREMGLDAADQELIRQFFTDQNHAFLVIRPVSMRECVGAFMFQRDGKLQTEPAHLPFPFKAQPASADAAPDAEPGPEPAQEEAPLEVEPPAPNAASVNLAPALAPAPAAPEIRKEIKVASRRRHTLPWVLLCLALTLAVLFGGEVWRAVTQPQWDGLGLNVSASESGLEVSWDPSLPAVRDARRGVLTITDGASENRVELNVAALARGRFTYRPSGNNVVVRFLIDGPDMKVSGETFRIVSSSKQEPASQKAVSEPAAPADGTAADAKEELKSGSRPEETKPAPDTSGNQAEAPAAAAAEQPTAPQPVPETPRDVPISVAAKAVHEMQPVVSEGIRARIRGQIIIPVTVGISASGRVVSAAPQGNGDAVYGYLASRAAEAARLWRFEPARSRNGKALASTKTLHFVFTP